MLATLGDDVMRVDNKQYMAYRRLQNFARVSKVRPTRPSSA
ncbi:MULTISPECIES: hypothetical protein [unclassified Streptomyces]